MIYINNNNGHRKFAAQTLSYIVNDHQITNRLNLRSIFCKNLIFVTIEDNIFVFFLLAFIRDMFKLKTGGLLFSPWDIFKKRSVKAKFKKSTLIYFKKRTNINVISYVPHYLDERYLLISKDWIYDLEFWDLNLLQRKHLISQNNNKNISNSIAYIGGLDKRKGIKLLAYMKTNAQSNNLNLNFVAKGKVMGDENEIFDAIEVLVAEKDKRHLTDEEFIETAVNSSFLWCCYEPSYDASSGIFGRALQLNKIPIIRENSVLDEISRYENLECIRIPFKEEQEVFNSFVEAIFKACESPNPDRSSFVTKAYSHSIKVIQAMF